MGNIFDSKTDVIVLSADKKLDLKIGGTLSRQCLDRVGELLQTELSQSYPKGVEWNQVVTTGAHNLSNIKRIFHVACPPFVMQTKQKVNSICQVTMQCLKLLDKENYESIALPAMGTGGLGYAPHTVAKSMVESVFEFLTKNFKKKFIVRFVIFDNENETFEVRKQKKRKFVTISLRFQVRNVLKRFKMSFMRHICCESFRPLILYLKKYVREVFFAIRRCLKCFTTF